jgi:hypothetical protein
MAGVPWRQREYSQQIITALKEKKPQPQMNADKTR